MTGFLLLLLFPFASMRDDVCPLRMHYLFLMFIIISIMIIMHVNTSVVKFMPSALSTLLCISN